MTTSVKRELKARIDKMNEDCVLLNFQRGFWTASAKMNKALLGKDVPKEIVRASQDLLPDKTLVSDILTVQNKARYFIVSNSLPFPFDCVYRVPIDKIVYVENKLQNTYLPMHQERVEILSKALGRLKSKFKKKYPKYYQPEKYPTRVELKQRFYIRWTPFYFNIPEHGLNVFDTNQYKMQIERIKSTLDEMEEMTITVIGNDLLERLDNLQTKCENGNIHGKTVGSINRFIDKWDDLWKGKVDDKKLETIVKQLRRQMKKVSSDRLKNNDDFRDKVQGRVSTIMKKLEKMPNVELKRKIDI